MRSRVERLGDSALRIERPPHASAASLLAAVRAWPRVVDAWLTEKWIAVSFAGDAIIDDANIDALATLTPDTNAPRTIEIAVRYDGADLADVARACARTEAEIIDLHLRAEYTVLFLGFRPGFAYLGGLARELVVPRLETPRARIAKNAVAIAGPYAGIYPFDGPGGWRVLGTALDVAMFDTEHGALLRAGDRVRFVRSAS